MGIADRFIAAGPSTPRAVAPSSASSRSRRSISPPSRARFPFALSLPQSETERLLSEHLQRLRDRSRARRRADRVLTQTSDAVRAVLRHADGREEIVETPWLDRLRRRPQHDPACSRHGFRRRAVRREFHPRRRAIGVDAARDRVHLFLGDDGVLGVIPFARKSLANRGQHPAGFARPIVCRT